MKRKMKWMILRRKKIDIVILTVEQAVSEAKWIDKNNNNISAIENRYGSTENCWEARSFKKNTKNAKYFSKVELINYEPKREEKRLLSSL